MYEPILTDLATNGVLLAVGNKKPAFDLGRPTRESGNGGIALSRDYQHQIRCARKTAYKNEKRPVVPMSRLNTTGLDGAVRAAVDGAASAGAVKMAIAPVLPQPEEIAHLSGAQQRVAKWRLSKNQIRFRRVFGTPYVRLSVAV